MVVNLLISIHALHVHMLTSLSVDKILLTRCQYYDLALLRLQNHIGTFQETSPLYCIFSTTNKYI